MGYEIHALASCEAFTVIVITGASRGFGQAFALAFAKQRALLDDTHIQMHLWARDIDGLTQTAALVGNECKNDAMITIEITTTQVDMNNRIDYSGKIESFLASTKEIDPIQVIIVHNAGTLGEIGLVQDLSSIEMLQDHMELNVSSVMWFNKRFLDLFGTRDSTAQVSTGKNSHIIVNISSLNAIEPFATCNTYCVIKAARDMHHRVIAIEQGNIVKTLNYAPGPMDTNMQLELRESKHTNEKLKNMFNQLKANNTYVDTLTSATLCIKHVYGTNFVSGSHVDYYDIA
ncbi:sepiapterin reductase [Thraustotheca clavata]|uniref:Sepiapterin reductase n=1 Tax=Thraustotheca clavata TaxID=74557 RepID=A0A1W0A4C1_9STRA|nr:sepiapterin reductase [Thraustotheca clavata]